MGPVKKQAAVHIISPLREEKKNVNILPVLGKKRMSLGGGIGIRDGLKIRFQQWIEGSSPSQGTTLAG